MVHVTTRASVEAIQRGRALGYPVMGESCTQYFFLTVDDHLAAPGFEGSKYVCSPPIRSEADHAVLWQALRDGSLQHVSTDHCNFWYEGGRGPWQEWAAAHDNGDWVAFEAQDPSYRRPGKELGLGNFSKIPNGMPGMEDRMMVMWQHGVNTGRISPTRFVELMCSNPAKIFGMYPQKGTIAVGSDADIAIWDPAEEHVLSVETTHMRTDYIVYEGMPIRGRPKQVWLRGKKIVDGRGLAGPERHRALHRAQGERAGALKRAASRQTYRRREQTTCPKQSSCGDTPQAERMVMLAGWRPVGRRGLLVFRTAEVSCAAQQGAAHRSH